MKRSLIHILMLCGLLMSLSVQANDYLELEKHYMVYTSGASSIHFKIPVWAYGRARNYYIHGSSYAIYGVQGKDKDGNPITVESDTICNFRSERYGANKNEGTQRGSAWLKMRPGLGVSVVTSMYNGTRYTVHDTGEWSPELTVKQVESDDCPQVTMLEFDWYPPEELNEKQFYIQLHLDIHASYTGNLNYQKDFRFTGPFSGSNNLMTPQLSEPYLYTVNGTGVTGYGQAAVQYTTFQQPIWYVTSKTPQDTVKISDRSGSIYVNTTDTVQEQFSATFGVYREESVGTKTVMTTPPVDIPPFHRIYQFDVAEERDSMGSLTGNNVLHWEIKNPELKDLVDNDYFELQRATKSDFSDAQTLNVINMRRSEESDYQYVDDSYQTQVRTTAGTQIDTINQYLSASKSGYVLTDASGQPMCEMNITMSNTQFVLPCAPVYYRIRRASASLWGWDHDFARLDTVYKHNYLAPLAQTQSDYTLDAEYEKNRTVHFRIRIENAETGYRPISLDACRLSFSRVRTMSDSVQYDIRYDDLLRETTWWGSSSVVGEAQAKIYVYAVHDGEEVFGAMPGKQLPYPANHAVLRMPAGSEVTVSAEPVQVVGDVSLRTTAFTFLLNDHATDEVRFRQSGNVFDLGYNRTTPYKEASTWLSNNGFMPEEQARLNAVTAELKQLMLPLIQEKNQSFGRCIWDRTARLLLCRTTVETGQTVEIIVPADSIVRQEDGSWLAHITDVAGEACTHYRYAVRIDQSDASIHVSDSSYLQPVAISGPNLYFDESATITSFTASQGAAEGNRKNGVQLAWTASSAAVDEYVLTRIVANSDQVPDTILRTVDTNWFDETAKPNVHYEYTVTALYSCNGKNTSNSASTEGWRTPYGQINGTILMPQNSGMAGVQVSLSADGETLRTMTTDATGTYLFDSLTYDLTQGTIYTITPTSQYGVFSYNNTSSGIASVSLAADRAVVSGIDFVNTSAVRITGRVLYQNSTIPVAGVAFVLNGDTVRRNGAPLLSGIDGSFELSVPKSQVLTLQATKAGHVFEGDGILRPESGSDSFSLVKPLDGVRFYDSTKVRLVGRVAGGNDQRALQHGFGLGKNNLGENLQIVLMLEGDNTAHIVHDPDDLTRDTMQQHVSYPSISGQEVETQTLFEQKRILIRPDVKTGEYAVDLFPVKYKVVQVTAKGYATLFPTGTGSETFDLTNAPLTVTEDSLEGVKVSYNAVYDRIYHAPVQVSLTQLNYGMEADGLGETQIQVCDVTPSEDDRVPLYTKEADGTVTYLLGYPVFMYNRRYQFMAQAFEEYLYNNEPSGAIDRVPLRSGSVTVQNGMSKKDERLTYELDSNGRNKAVWLTVDDIDLQSTATNALKTVSVALQYEGNTVEATAFRAFVEGSLVQPETLQSTEADLALLDIVRDPGGSGSSAYIESGATYRFAYTENYQWKAGVVLTPSWTAGVTQDIGIVTIPNGAGTYIGATYSTKRELSFDIPIVNEWKWGYKYDYTFTTTDRISTSSAKSAMGVGANADVFIGVTTSQLAGKAKTIALISDSLYQARQPAIQSGAMKVLRQGFDTLGNVYYLVTGEKVVAGSRIGNTFAYSQGYILQTLIPMYVLQRQNLLMNFGSREEAQEVADATGEPVYWNLRQAPASMRDTLNDDEYKMIVPNNGQAYTDEVKALDNIIWKWITLIYTNEKEKVMARTSGQSVGTFSVNYGNSLTHSDSYSAMANYNEMPQGADLYWSEVQVGLSSIASDILTSLSYTSTGFIRSFGKSTLGESVASAVKDYFNYENGINLGKKEDSKLGTKTNTSEFEFSFVPVFGYDCDDNRSLDNTQKKTAGFTIVSDDQGDITVSVYRARLDSVWKEYSANIRTNTGASNDMLYGSYVFFTQAGSSFCPYEGEERTLFYNPGTLLNTATEHIAKPELSAQTYELTGVPSDQRAKFRIELKNAGQVETGQGASGMEFSLALVSASNPDGAKIYINGAPLARPIGYFIQPGQTINQLLEVEKGEADDYENLQLIFGPTDCPKTFTTMDLSVHFLPESSPVQLASPRDRWVMNTLSPKDSIGYYLPVTIDGFDIHHKNFDHIEFQYKLSTENDDAWVNQCSFFAEDSLYALASGNKAMIENGRIMPFRFYGEKDPKELEYDLRAVSFCRYGSGFVTKASPVIRGTKDTRPPVLFGKAQPANGILTIEDDISLRFSEPIAGNWLDEDNNFQILGVTNATGITQTTSLYFDGITGHDARTKAPRELAITDLSLDMLIKPVSNGKEMALLSHGDEQYNFTLSLTADNRLKVSIIDDGVLRETKLSKPMEALSTTDFTRVIMVYDFDRQTLRFYVGTKDITDSPSTSWLLQNDASPFVLGAALDGSMPFQGNMMEVRVWTKPLTPAEISNTHLRHLTGYEYGLLDYYPLTESKGSEMKDLASGATLYANGLSWTTPQGISLGTNGTPVRLQPTLFSRSEAEDYSLLFWFRSDNTSSETVSLFGTSLGDSTTMEIELHNGEIRYHAGSVDVSAHAQLTDSRWHHVALIVSKTFNSGAVLIDGESVLLFPTLQTGALSGTQVWIAKGLKGNVDDLCLFEQALPTDLVNEFGMQTPSGEEMGLINLLSFSQIQRNASNVMELVFSPNNQRVFKDLNGIIVHKEQILLIDDLSTQADKNNAAPVSDRGQLTNLPFTWNYQLSDLLINIKAQAREINKRTMYLTVRDVEDLNGNRLPSPVTWSVYADLNSVRWNERTHEELISDQESEHRFTVRISNQTGRTRQYTIENLPKWMTVSTPYGTLGAEEEKTITFILLTDRIKIGLHNRIIYLTDDEGLSEPLLIQVTKETEPPYPGVDKSKYPFNMSLCGRVRMERSGKTVIATDEDDYVYAFHNNECVGMAHPNTNGEVYLTVFGNTAMERKPVRFQLWQASTGKIYQLTPDSTVLFAQGAVLGCGSGEPVLFTAGGAEMQTIALKAGWNWVSTYLDLQPFTAQISRVLSAAQPWSEGDLIKNPATQHFVTYSEEQDAFVGQFNYLRYIYTYMVYCRDGNTMRISGERLPADSMYITLQGDGQWSALPCLYDEPVTLRDALADYYDHASVGDIIKSHTRFAMFSADRKWVGDLTALTPGEGYFFRRLASGPVKVNFYQGQRDKVPSTQDKGLRKSAATNMTIIAKVQSDKVPSTKGKVMVYQGDDLVGMAEPLHMSNLQSPISNGEVILYFLTIQSDAAGSPLRFETEDGQELSIVQSQIIYLPDAHYGSVESPVILTPSTKERDGGEVFKIIENEQIIIIRNNEKYSITGTRLQ